MGDVDSTTALVKVSTDVTLPYPSTFNDQFQACQLPLFFASIADLPLQNAVVYTLEQCPFETFVSDPNSPWSEATAKCLDDYKDAEAIQFAQIVCPIALVLFFFSTAVGYLSVKGNKYASLSSSILAFIGALLILIALLKLYQAPIYDNVGAPIEVYKPHYKGSVGRWLGLISIGTGLISAILFLLAVCLCQPSEIDGSYRDIKVKESPGEEQQGGAEISAA